MIRRSYLFPSSTTTIPKYFLPLAQSNSISPLRFLTSTENNNNNQSTHSPSSWTYEQVDKDGKTRLDKVYEETAFRVQQQFQKPIEIYQGNNDNDAEKNQENSS